jgi:hypothetical protein
MKKIVGILAAAALIATSVFAADVSAQVRIAGDIFAYDGAAIDAKEGKVGGSFSMLRAATQSQPYWTPYITLSTSTDEAGAEVKFITGGDGTTDVSIDRSNVWFKPLDMLTIKAGFQGYNMHQEDIDWTNPTGAEDWGYAVSFAQDAISANVYLITGNNGWFFQDAVGKYGTTDEPATSYIKDLYINGAYAADFGTITAMFEFKGKQMTAEGANPNIIKFGAGYGNTFDNLSFWADVVGTSYGTLSDKELLSVQAAANKALMAATGYDITGAVATDSNADTQAAYTKAKGAFDALSDAEKADTINGIVSKYAVITDKDGKSRSAFGLFVDGYVKYEQDALKVRGYAAVGIADFGHETTKDGELKKDIMADNNFSLGLKARVDYKLDNGINLFAYFGSDNLLRKETTPDSDSGEWKDAKSVFVSTIKAGADGSVGICKWETYLQFDTGVNVLKSSEAKENNKFDKVSIKMPVTLTVAF